MKTNETPHPDKSTEPLTVEAVDLGDLDSVEESLAPLMATGCACGGSCK